MIQTIIGIKEKVFATIFLHVGLTQLLPLLVTIGNASVTAIVMKMERIASHIHLVHQEPNSTQEQKNANALTQVIIMLMAHAEHAESMNNSTKKIRDLDAFLDINMQEEDVYEFVLNMKIKMMTTAFANQAVIILQERNVHHAQLT